MLKKFICMLLITTTVVGIGGANLNKVSAQTLNEVNVPTINITEEEKNQINSQREEIKKELREFDLSDELIDELIEKHLSGVMLDCYNPDMEQYATTERMNGCIVKRYPDGSISATTDLSSKARTFESSVTISSSNYHRKVKTYVKHGVGILFMRYFVVWTDVNAANVLTTIDDYDLVSTVGCTFNGFTYYKSQNRLTCMANVGSLSTITHSVRAGTGELYEC